MRDGLPSNIITCIAQDKYDFMWIGTGSGLARYDGYDFKIFKKNESLNSIPYNDITTLLALDGFVWVGTWNGLCKVDVETFEVTRVDFGEKSEIRTLFKGKGNILWIGTNDGLIQYSLESGKYDVFTIENSNLSHNTIRSIYEDVEGNLFVGTYDKLNFLMKGEKQFQTLNLDADKHHAPLHNHLILNIKPQAGTNDQFLWVGTENGLYSLNTISGESAHFCKEKIGFSNDVIKYIYADEALNLWLGTDFGLNIFNPKKLTVDHSFHNPKEPYTIPNNVIWQIFKDRSGVIWLATSNGLSRINSGGNFYAYHDISHSIENQLIGNQVKSVLVSSSGIYWLGTQHGVIRKNPKTGSNRFFDFSSNTGNNVFALEEDQFGRIWIGTTGGINIWDEARQQMSTISANDGNGLISNYIGKLLSTEDGSFWVSEWEGGLFKVTDLSEEPDDLKFAPISGLESGSEKVVFGNEHIWVVEFDELYKVNPDDYSKTHIESFNKASKKQMIFSVYFSKSGHLWAGTVNGLIQYLPVENKSIFHPVITGNEVIITSIIEDQKGNIWTSSNASIHKLYPGTSNVEIYPLNKDLPLKSFYYGCAAITDDNQIIFGGDNGYIIFSPDEVKPNLFNSNIYITAIEINNQRITVGDTVGGKVLLQKDVAFTEKLVLDYELRSLTFEFSSLHFWQPSMNEFSYRLDGLENEWNHVSGVKNFAVYSNLPSGEYTFMVRGTNNNGITSDQTASLNIVVKPPLLLSKGFVIFYFFLIIGIIYYGLRFYSTRVHLKNELKIIKMAKLHAEEIERTKEEFFTNISHELRTPISLILPPIHELQKKEQLDNDSKKLIHLAEKNSVRLLRLVNQILDFHKLENETLQLKVSHLDLIHFCREVYSLFQDQAQRTDTTFNFHTTHQSYDVWFDVEKMEAVLFNVLSNAFKFTPSGGKIELSVLVQESSPVFKEGAFEIQISDTGIGITSEDQEKIFERFYQSGAGSKEDSSSGIGLTMAYEYVELHHGKIEVDSQLGKGTSFRVRLPLGKSHFPLDSVTENEVSLLATRSLYSPSEGSKNFHFDLDSDKPQVLIIEDNTDMVEFIRASLGHKYNFLVAENGEEGLIKADSFMPEVIISDIMMPVMDGLTMCKKIKENPKTSHITIILLTAKSLESQQLEGIIIGADVYLTKPFEIEFLEAHINNLINRKKELNFYFKNELADIQSLPNDKDNLDNKFVLRVMDIIEANITHEDFGVELIAHEIGMSSTHLYRKIKGLTNRTPKDVIKKYRLKKASLLLKNNEGNVSEVMYKVGFSSISYFSKCFKAEFGMTPKEYQQENTLGQVTIKEDIS